MTRIYIDAKRKIGKISPYIYGAFMEDIGRIIYGGIYEPSSPLSDEKGIRKDVLKKVQELQPSVLRWPGGNFASGYHWKNGIGPRKKRPLTFDLAWHTAKSNEFGTDEFIEFCWRIPAEPYICVNLGNGTPEEAAEWVEYCNGTYSTQWAEKRKENDYLKPFRVRYWGLGNEVWGTFQIGHKDAMEYAKVAQEAGKMMKWVDPSIKLVLCGGYNDVEWSSIVLEKNYGLVDYISIHRYDGDDTYYGTLAAPKCLERDIEVTAAAIRAVKYQHRPFSTIFIKPTEHIYIAVDEWGIWYRRQFDDKKREGESYTEEFYNLRDALYVGIVLNVFQRHCNEVKMANFSQLLNTIGPIYTTPSQSFYQSIYWPLKIYRAHCQKIVLDVYSDSPCYNPADFEEEGEKIKEDYRRMKNVPYLDISASINEREDILTLCVVNRHKDDDIKTEISLNEFSPLRGDVYEINGSQGAMAYSLKATGPTIEDTECDPEACYVKKKKLEKVSGKFVYIFPAHSISVIKLLC